MPEPEFKLEYDRSVIGVEHTVIAALPVTARMISDFARALGEEDPIYWDEAAARGGRYGGLVALPTFSTIFNFRFVGGGPDLKLAYGTQVFEGGQSVENYHLIRPGDTLRATTKVTEVFAKTGRQGTMVFIVNEDSFYNLQGERVSKVTRTLIRR